MEVKSRIWIEKNGKPFLGNGRVALLKAIQQTQSINAASKKMKMSYKKAWLIIKEMEALVEQPIVVKVIGGKDGGGSTITDYGMYLIRYFEEINQKQVHFINEQFKTESHAF
jgi:molybdate transport system regulatory protein